MTISLLVWILVLILRFEHLDGIGLPRRGFTAWRGVLSLFRVSIHFSKQKIGGLTIVFDISSYLFGGHFLNTQY
jgi:hypothetical protein